MLITSDEVPVYRLQLENMQMNGNEDAAAACQKSSNDSLTNGRPSLFALEIEQLIPPCILQSPASPPHLLPAPIPTSSSTSSYPASACNSTADTPILDAMLGMDTHSAEHFASGSTPHIATHPRDLTQEIILSDPHVIACGGCSNIYHGEWAQRGVAGDADRRVPVALKVPRTSKGKRDPVRLQQLLNQEVKILLRLDHLNVVRLLGTALVLGGERTIVLPWYGNGTVVTYMRGRSVGCRLRLVKDVCAGVKYLHSLEPPVVHGDLKGENVLVSDNGHAVISDFGLSSETQNSAQNTVGGSLRWQAPELLFDDDGDDDGNGDCWADSMLSVGSDVWAFGCTTYEILLGHLPYHDQQLDWAIIQDIMRGNGPVRPEDTLIRESRVLSDLLDKCWSLRPCDRPAIVEVASIFLGIGG